LFEALKKREKKSRGARGEEGKAMSQRNSNPRQGQTLRYSKITLTGTKRATAESFSDLTAPVIGSNQQRNHFRCSSRTF